MPDLLTILTLGSAALIGFTIAGVAGFGGGAVILPALVLTLGPRDAIPILSVAQWVASIVRFWMYRKEVDWPLIRWFAIGAVPIAVLASLLFVVTPTALFIRALGAGLLLLVAYPYTPWGKRAVIGLRGFPLVGAATSFFSGFLGIGGPVPAPFVLAYGLVGSAYVGTMGFCTLITQSLKLVVFGGSVLLNTRTVAIGLGLGALSWVGARLGRRLLTRLPAQWFTRLVECLLLASGILFLVQG